MRMMKKEGRGGKIGEREKRGEGKKFEMEKFVSRYIESNKVTSTSLYECSLEQNFFLEHKIGKDRVRERKVKVILK